MMPLSCPRGGNQAGVAMKRFDAFASRRLGLVTHSWQGALVAAALALPAAGQAGDLVTICTKLDICYCVNSDYRDAISANVARVRQLLSSNKAQGKTIGYLSI